MRHGRSTIRDSDVQQFSCRWPFLLRLSDMLDVEIEYRWGGPLPSVGG